MGILRSAFPHLIVGKRERTRYRAADINVSLIYTALVLDMKYLYN